MRNVISKLDTWSDNLPGNNYEAREKIFSDTFNEIIEVTPEIDDVNLLMLQEVF